MRSIGSVCLRPRLFSYILWSTIENSLDLCPKLITIPQISVERSNRMKNNFAKLPCLQGFQLVNIPKQRFVTKKKNRDFDVVSLHLAFRSEESYQFQLQFTSTLHSLNLLLVKRIRDTQQKKWKNLSATDILIRFTTSRSKFHLNKFSLESILIMRGPDFLQDLTRVTLLTRLSEHLKR